MTTSEIIKATNNTVLPKWQAWLHRDRAPSTALKFHLEVQRWASQTDRLGRSPTTITNQELWEWVNREDGTKVATKQFALASLRSYFSWCQAEGYCQHNPAAKIKVRVRDLSHAQKEPEVRRPFTQAEYERVLKHLALRIVDQKERLEQRIKANHHQRLIALDSTRLQRLQFWFAAVVLGRQTGLRLCDVCKLETESDMGDQLVVHTRKTGSRITVPITPEMRSVLPKINGRYFFPSEANLIDAAKGDRLSKDFERLLKQCGIAGVSYHCLRYAFAQSCRDEGKPVWWVQEALGHSNERQTRHYTQEQT